MDVYIIICIFAYQTIKAMNNKSRFLQYAQSVLKTIGTAYDVAELFGFDYSNVKKWFRNYDSIPISTAFMIFDYSNAKLVVFKNY